jgi:hypothetical protein
MSRFVGRFSIIALIVLGLGACAPSGYHYGKWSDGPAAAFAATPNDDCQRAETQRGIVSALNGRVGQVGGPSASVASAERLVTVPNGAIDGPTLTCRGWMRTASGIIGPGVVVVRLADSSSSNTIAVKDALWETDADRERREALERREQAKRVAEAPAREAKMMEEMRTSAQSAPDKTVHCGIGESHFWTANSVCFALIEEARQISSKFGKVSRYEIVQECANDIALKLPGKDQPTYLNACEELVGAYTDRLN